MTSILKKAVTSMGFAAALLVATAANAYPTLAGIVDRGDSGGQHYYEVYFNVDPGFYCSSSSEIVYATSTPPDYSVVSSYAGPSGYSQYVCQVNIHSATGSGSKTVPFLVTGNGGGPSGTFAYITFTF